MITNYSQSGVRYREYFDWKPRNVSDSVKYHGLHNLYIQRPGDSWSSRIRLQMEHFAFSKAPAWLLAWFMTSPFYRSSDDKSCFTQAGGVWLLTPDTAGGRYHWLCSVQSRLWLWSHGAMRGAERLRLQHSGAKLRVKFERFASDSAKAIDFAKTLAHCYVACIFH